MYPEPPGPNYPPPEPTQPWPAAQVSPAAEPALPEPVPPARSWVAPVLVALSIALAAGLVVVIATGYRTAGQLRRDVAAVEADRDRLRDTESDIRVRQQNQFATAGLPGRLQRVKDLDKATDAAFAQWSDGTVKFGVLDKAMDDCDDAIDEYDRTAAPFPANLLGVMPQQINLNNPETDCGRAFTGRI